MSGRLGIYSQVGNSSSIDPDAQAVINQMTTNGSTPSAGRQVIINQLVLDLKGIGNTGPADIFSLFDILNIHAAEDAIQSQTQWINSNGTYDSTQVNSPTFTADLGFSASNNTNTINPVWTPSVALGNYTQNDASIGIYGTANNAGYFIGTSDYQAYIRIRDIDTDQSLNNGGFPNGNWGSFGRNLYISDRTVSGSFNMYLNGLFADTVTATSSALSSSTIKYPVLLSTPGTQTAEIVFFGASIRNHLTQLKDSFDAYLTSL
jgi:hypothetical protein